MYAVVDIAGKQFKVEKDQEIIAPLLHEKEGTTVQFDRVLLVENKGKIDIGAPTVKGMKVSAKVIGHGKGDKVIVFKKKKRKGYQVKNGHRQDFTKLLISKISK